MKEAFPTGVSTEAMTGMKQRNSLVQEVPYSDPTISVAQQHVRCSGRPVRRG